jgi:hypothetical protein
MDERVQIIKDCKKKKMSTKEITAKLGIKTGTYYNLCTRNNIINDGKSGRPNGSYDTKPRKTMGYYKKTPIPVQGGSSDLSPGQAVPVGTTGTDASYNLNWDKNLQLNNNSSNIDTFIESVYSDLDNYKKSLDEQNNDIKQDQGE